MPPKRRRPTVAAPAEAPGEEGHAATATSSSSRGGGGGGARTRGALGVGWLDQPGARAAVCFAVGAAVFLNTLSVQFPIDDNPAVKRNPDVKTSTPVGDVWRHDFWGQDYASPESHKSYRPLTVMTYRANYAVHGFEPMGYHLVNVVLHGAVSALYVHTLETVLPGDPFATFSAGLFYATHPIHTEAVANLVGRAELLCALFALAGLLAYVQSSRGGGWAWYAGFVACTMASILCKETGITFFGVAVLHDALFVPGVVEAAARGDLSSKSPLRGPAARLLASVCVVGVYLAFRRWMGGTTFVLAFSFLDNPIAHSHGLERVLSTLYLHAYYAYLLIYPVPLCVDYSYNCIPLVRSLADPRVLAIVATYVGAAAIGLAGWRRRGRDPAVLLGLGVAVLTFLPSAQVFLAAGTVIAERLMYLPSMGFCLLCGWVVGALAARKRKQLGAAVAVAVVALYGVRTVLRNEDWQSNAALRFSAYGVCPGSIKVQYTVAVEYIQHKEFGKAKPILEHISGEYPSGNYFWRLGQVNFAMRDLPSAIGNFTRALQAEGVEFDVWADLGMLYAVIGQLDQAEELLRRAAETYPHKQRARNVRSNLAATLGRAGKLQEAVNIYQELLREFPYGSEYRNNLGAILYRGGRHDDAVENFRVATERPNPIPDMQRNYMSALQREPGFVPQVSFIMDEVGTLHVPIMAN